MKEVLEYNGRAENRTGSPRSILKLAYQCGMIGDEEKWLELLDARNIPAHTYSSEDALKEIGDIKECYLGLFEALKRTIDGEWETGDEN